MWDYMSICLRTRILQDYIRCIPWRYWKGEIGLLPISSKTLFARRGLSIDLLEIDLRSENFLLNDQVLLDVIKDEINLKCKKIGIQWEETEDSSFGLFPDDWIEEDYKYYNNQKKKG